MKRSLSFFVNVFLLLFFIWINIISVKADGTQSATGDPIIITPPVKVIGSKTIIIKPRPTQKQLKNTI